MSTQLDRGPGLEREGIETECVKWNLSDAALYEEALRRGEGVLVAHGPLACRTGHHTGRSPLDKFVVREPSSEAHIEWGRVNQPMNTPEWDALHRDLLAALKGRELYVLDAFAGADPLYRLPIRIITEYAWHNLFCRNLFIVDPADPSAHTPQFTVIDSPSFRADPARHGTKSDVVIALNFAEKIVLIGGTSYAGEIKKSIFSVLNYTLPMQGVLSMHCSANVGRDGDVALFFGLSGTGKTTLSSDPDRMLIGDDEHGWSDRGVFNFEGGCYAKTIKLSAEAEPQIFATTRRFGTVLENVVVDPETRLLDLDDDRYTENTRAAYPIAFIDNAVRSGQGGHPRNIVMLTADAFGVLPPISRLSADGAMYHFLSGYTAKVAGTEKGVTEPKATFSTCFGAPFLPLPPGQYARMLGDKIAQHGVCVWLVNTGWTGGPYGVGTRMKIAFTRAMIRAALSGALDSVPYDTDPMFNLDVPTSCPGVPAEVLKPRNTWPSAAAYDTQAKKLAAMFVEPTSRRSRRASVPPSGRQGRGPDPTGMGAAALIPDPDMSHYEAVIGLEIHAHLLTASKIFCGCSAAFGGEPNTHICPVCLGLPGALPVLNRAAVDDAVRAAVALGCTVHEMSIFARKNYFYPDLPKGYQISQYERPLATRGAVAFTSAGQPRRVGITRVHLEEDAGKSLHEGFPDSDRKTYLDYNRSGVPLIEIVTEPDLRSAADAAEFFSQLRALLVWLGVNDGNMEEGSLRCDANVSVRRAGAASLGTKAEVKNLNSFRFLQKALEYEIARQIDTLSGGGRIVQETRLWDSAAGRTVGMRSKEEAHDYRYFPEPDLPPVVVDAARLAAIEEAMPELPAARRRRFVGAYGLSDYDAGQLTQSRGMSDFFEAAVHAGAPPKAAGNWIMGELARLLNETGGAIERSPVPPGRLAGLIALVEKGTISGPIAKGVLETMHASGRSADEIVAAEGLRQIDDEAAILGIVDEVLAAQPDAVAQVPGPAGRRPSGFSSDRSCGRRPAGPVPGA